MGNSWLRPAQSNATQDTTKTPQPNTTLQHIISYIISVTSLIKGQRKRKIGSTRQESGIKLKDIPDRIKYVKALLKDYSKQPQDTRHGGIISPSSATSKIPNDFVWCRISHYNVKITVIGTVGNSHVGSGRATLLIQLVGTTPQWYTTYLEMCL